MQTARGPFGTISRKFATFCPEKDEFCPEKSFFLIQILK